MGLRGSAVISQGGIKDIGQGGGGTAVGCGRDVVGRRWSETIEGVCVGLAPISEQAVTGCERADVIDFISRVGGCVARDQAAGQRGRATVVNPAAYTIS